MKKTGAKPPAKKAQSSLKQYFQPGKPSTTLAPPPAAQQAIEEEFTPDMLDMGDFDAEFATQAHSTPSPSQPAATTTTTSPSTPRKNATATSGSSPAKKAASPATAAAKALRGVTPTSALKKKGSTDKMEVANDDELTEKPAKGAKLPSRYDQLNWKERKREANKQTAQEKAANRYAFLADRQDAQKRNQSDPEFDTRTLFIPQQSWITMTEYEKQFWRVKQKMMDCVVFFHKGFFYELYEIDAEVGRKELGLTIASDLRCNMHYVGFPKSQWKAFANKLISRGYKIARVDEEGKKSKDDEEGAKTVEAFKENQITKRELQLVMTSGTIVDEEFISDYHSNYLLAITEKLQTAEYGVCILDASCAEFQLGRWSEDDLDLTSLKTLLFQLQPREIIYERKKLSKAVFWTLKSCCPEATLEAVPTDDAWDSDATLDKLTFGHYFVNYEKDMATFKSKDELIEKHWPAAIKTMAGDALAMSALGIVLAYLQRCKLEHLVGVKNFKIYDPKSASGVMRLGGRTIQTLELFQNEQTQTEEGSLVQLLDRCSTKFGHRLLRRWIAFPLYNYVSIIERHDTVETLIKYDVLFSAEIRRHLGKLPDLERMLSRVHDGNLSLAEFLKCLEGLELALDIVTKIIPNLVSELGSPDELNRGLLGRMFSIFDVEPNSKDSDGSTSIPLDNIGFPNYTAILQPLKASFDRDKAKKEEIIVPISGYDEIFDKAKEEVDSWQTKLNEYLQKQQVHWKTSKVKFVDVRNDRFLLEMPVELTKDQKPPSSYKPVTGTKKAARFLSTDTADMVESLKAAELELQQASREILSRYLKKLDENYRVFRLAIMHLGELDCLLSLASVSSSPDYTRPTLVASETPFLRIEDMKHPCLAFRNSDQFVANSLSLGQVPSSTNGTPSTAQPNVVLLTGPNMGGKSTLLRQVCLTVVMAQIGCFVHANRCEFSPVDRIFTRLGAFDNIFTGQSTFMVELSETGKVLLEATKDSLVILDELGRGTSTFDGYAIAFSVLNDLATRIGCRTLFSTHYHMLTDEFNLTTHPERAGMVALYHMSALVGGTKTTDMIQQDQQQNDADGDAVMTTYDSFATQNSSSSSAVQDVVFLYKLEKGVCPKSYGINVAKMAEVPAEVLAKADKIATAFSKSKNLAEFKVTTRKQAILRQKRLAIEQLFALSKQAEAELAVPQASSNIKAQAQAFAQLAMTLTASAPK